MKSAKNWLHGLVAVVITGAANAAILVIASPEKFSFGDLVELGRVALALALVNAATYLKQSPLPK
jgi:hypothetical protein